MRRRSRRTTGGAGGFKRRKNGRHHAVEVFAHFVRPEATNNKPALVEHRIAPGVMRCLLWLSVLRAIDLHDQPRFTAHKIENVGFLRRLARKRQPRYFN